MTFIYIMKVKSLLLRKWVFSCEKENDRNGDHIADRYDHIAEQQIEIRIGGFKNISYRNGTSKLNERYH